MGVASPGSVQIGARSIDLVGFTGRVRGGSLLRSGRHPGAAAEAQADRNGGPGHRGAPGPGRRPGRGSGVGAPPGFVMRLTSFFPALLLLPAACGPGPAPGKAREPLPADTSARADTPASADAGWRLLFRDVGAALPERDQEAIYREMDLTPGPDGRSLVVADAPEAGPVTLSATIVDLDGDGSPEVFLVGGNTYVSGATGSSVWLFVRSAAGRWTPQLGVPAAAYTLLPEKSAGLPDVQLSGMGFCDGVWRWDGTAYAHDRDVPTEPGGCDAVSGGDGPGGGAGDADGDRPRPPPRQGASGTTVRGSAPGSRAAVSNSGAPGRTTGPIRSRNPSTGSRKPILSVR